MEEDILNHSWHGVRKRIMSVITYLGFGGLLGEEEGWYRGGGGGIGEAVC
jgi:hypothetical protein